jgi:hypothetical protein
MMQALMPTLALLILNLAEGAPIKYKFNGYGANAQIYWQEDGCDYGSFIDLNAGESVSKVQANGKPETSKSPSVYTYYERWYDCSSDSATHTYLYMDYDASPSTSIAIKKLESASVSSTFGAFIVTENCVIECGSYEEDGETYTYCYPVCKQVSVEKAEVTLQATFVGTGNAYTSTYRSNNRDPNGFSRYKYSGRSRDATLSVIAFAVDDTTITIPSDAEMYASIYTTNSGELSMYRNSN